MSFVALTGCGLGLGQDPKHISFCSKSEANGKFAEVGAGDESDPEVILDYARKNEFTDRTVGFWTGIDSIDGLGEVVCQIRGSSPIELRFLPSVEKSVVENYQTDVDTVQKELAVTTTSTG